MKNCICTIVAKNYWAHARTLMRSLREHHPDARLAVLLIDEPDVAVPETENLFDVLRLADIGIPNQEGFCFKYNIIELSTAVKPWLIRHLAESGAEKVVYLDPDILCTAPLDDVFAMLDQSSIVLTPHIDEDYPNDGKRPNDADVLRGGACNLGFLAIRADEEGLRMIHWLQGKLYAQCQMDHAYGYFVDQRFFDLVPSLFERVRLLKAKQYNIAYWNLHSRYLTHQEGLWMCDGKPVVFFHFSGFSPACPDLISKHSNRFTMQEREDLKPLFDQYAALMKKQGWEEYSGFRCPYSTFSNGAKIHPGVRQFYLNREDVQKRIEHPFSSPELIRLNRKVSRIQKTLGAIRGCSGLWARLRYRLIYGKRKSG